MAKRKRKSTKHKMEKPDKSSWLLFAGFAVLGVALMLLIFGGDLFGGSGDTALEQIPALAADGGTAPIVTGNGQPLQVGDTAYDFMTLDVDGNPIRLSDFRGQPVVVNFWATWCPPCRRELPDFQNAYREHRQDGLVILAVNQDEPVELVRSFFYEENGFTFTPVLDEGSRISGDYGVRSFPTTIFVDAEGVVTAVHQGLLLPDQLEAYLAQTIPNQG